MEKGHIGWYAPLSNFWCNFLFRKTNVTVHTLSDLWLNSSFRNLFGGCHVCFTNISLLDCSEGLAPRAISHRTVNCSTLQTVHRKKVVDKATKHMIVLFQIRHRADFKSE